MENVSDQLLAQKKSFSSTVQTDVEHWQRTARELMLKEILPSTDITLRKILVPCSYVVFERDILPVEMIGVRYEYINGQAVITLYACFGIHNAVGSFGWNEWLRRPPGLEHLHTDCRDSSLDNLVFVTKGFLTKYRAGDSDEDRQDFAPDVHFSSILSSRPDRPFIVFEVAYPEEFIQAREKAKDYLWSDEPHPTAVVIFDVTKECNDPVSDTLTVEFEVLRRNADKPGGLQTYEKGYAYPPETIVEYGGPREIKFTLEEIVGTQERFDLFLKQAKSPEGIQDDNIRGQIEALEDGLFLKIRNAVRDNLSTTLPIKCFEGKLDKALIAEESRVKNMMGSNEAKGSQPTDQRIKDGLQRKVNSGREDRS